MHLIDLYNYSQRSAYVGFPCNGLARIFRFSLSLRCTSDTCSLHMQRMPTENRARRSRQNLLKEAYLMKKTLN